MRDNTFLFYFRNHENRFRMLAGGPWSFDNSLLVLEQLNGVGDINKLGFNKVEFWVQIRNAPLLCMTREMGDFLGQLVGDLRDIDVGSIGECFGKYMRVRVVIDVSKPLERFLRMDLSGNGDESLLLLRYEKLLDYCFCCGVVGHSYSQCRLGLKDGVRDAVMEFDFRPWMRAFNPPSSNKTVMNYQPVR